MKKMVLLCWGGVTFTLMVPIIIGLVFKDTSTMWIAALCGAFVTFMARIDEIAELSLGPVRAKMRETIDEANATVEQLRNISAKLAKVILTDLMSGVFLGGMPLKTRLNLHDQIISDLKDIGTSESAINDADNMWSKGIGMLYSSIINKSLAKHVKTSTPEVLEASMQFRKLLNFSKWQAPTPDVIREFIENRGLMNDEISDWILDYHHFIETKQIRRRELFENID